MKIAICDDESIWIENTKMLLEKWANENSQNITISTFQSAESFWFNYNKNEFDLLLLDIQMSGESGIELARKLRLNDDEIYIIFITAISDYIAEGYEVSAVHYLLKPINEEKLFSSLDKVLKEKNTKKEKILIKTENEDIIVNIDDIYYIEASAHDTIVNVCGKRILAKITYGQLVDCINSPSFIKCHRSYTVNLRFVRSVKKFETTLDNKIVIPISRRMYNDFSMAFISYYKSLNC